MSEVTAPQSEIAVPGQYEITICLVNGEVQLHQEDDLITYAPRMF